MVRAAAWTLIAAGALVGLYLVYSLFFTNLRTGAEQERLLEDWRSRADAIDLEPVVDASPSAERTPAPSGRATENPVVAATPPPAPEPPSGEAVALLWFERPGGSPPVTAKPYVVLSGVRLTDLAKGPGHYPQTDGPGEQGNFAVAGHRTTNGAPFLHLDDLREGDSIHVMDAAGEEYVYAFREQRIVAPSNVSVLRSQPLPDVRSTITLTTCHPRFSNRERLIVFGELVT